MFSPTAGSTGRLVTLPGNLTAPTASTARSSSVTLDPLTLDVSPEFHVSMLGTSRQVGAAMAKMERGVTVPMEEIYTQLGETDRNVVGRTLDFIDKGELPEESINEDFFARAAELNAADTEQTRESRLRTVLEAGLELLEKAKGPAFNLMNVTARTGLIVTLTTVLRQLVSYYVEQAVREGDSTDAARAWAVAAITMIGPVMSLMGAIRDECAGTATVQTRLGRVCMASITMGAFLLSHLTGASKNMLTAVVGTNVYTVARDVANAFFPLQDNAGAPTSLSTGVSTAAYGAVQFALEQLNALMPLSGAGRYAAQVGYSLGADVIQGTLNAVGAITDDSIFILCRNWSLLSPAVGLDSALSDPESLQRSVLEVRAGARVPSRAQLANALLNVNASRTSAFQALNHALGSAIVLLALTDLDDDSRVQLLIAGSAMVLMIIYYPFIWTCSQRTDNQWSPEQLRENPAP